MPPVSILSLRQKVDRKVSLVGRDNLLRIIESFLDSGALVACLWGIGLHYDGAIPPEDSIIFVLLFLMNFPGVSRLNSTLSRLMLGIMSNWAVTVSLLLVLGYYGNFNSKFSNAVLIAMLWIAPLAQLGSHLALRVAAPFLIRLEGPPKRAIIVGCNEQGLTLARRIVDNPYLSIKLVGIFDDRQNERAEDPGYLPLLGTLFNLPNFVKENHIQSIYLSLPMTSQPRILQLLDDLKDTTASIYFVPDLFVADLIQGRSGFVCDIPIISVCETPFTGASGIVKRVSDVVLSLIILLLIMPLMVIIAVAIKLDSPGPVIFRQRRYGLDGEEILVFKFRSMTVCEDGGTIQQARRNDNRITRLGAFLRKSSLDELPQFFNVLQGKMSIVGPRPHAVAHNELYRTLIKGYMIRHKVKPGITGWAQVNGFRGETETLDKMQSRINCDLDYLRNWSLTLDFKIILKTIIVVLKDPAAY